MPAGNCPTCNSSSHLDLFNNGWLDLYEVRCRRCGEYVITDFAKDSIERALQLNNTGIDQYLAMGDSSAHRSETAICIEVAKQAANGRGIIIFDCNRDTAGGRLRSQTRDSYHLVG